MHIHDSNKPDKKEKQKDGQTSTNHPIIIDVIEIPTYFGFVRKIVMYSLPKRQKKPRQLLADILAYSGTALFDLGLDIDPRDNNRLLGVRLGALCLKSLPE